jgi:hypothetical protein
MLVILTSTSDRVRWGRLQEVLERADSSPEFGREAHAREPGHHAWQLVTSHGDISGERPQFVPTLVFLGVVSKTGNETRWARSAGVAA